MYKAFPSGHQNRIYFRLFPPEDRPDVAHFTASPSCVFFYLNHLENSSTTTTSVIAKPQQVIISHHLILCDTKHSGNKAINLQRSESFTKRLLHHFASCFRVAQRILIENKGDGQFVALIFSGPSFWCWFTEFINILRIGCKVICYVNLFYRCPPLKMAPRQELKCSSSIRQH